MIIFYLLLFGLVLPASMPTNTAMSDTMEIRIIRTKELSNCTLGTLGVNDASLAASLELPWKENQQNVSRVPAGRYHTVLRYDHADRWRLELNNVLGHKNIQIHMGNWPSDTEGCILIGKVNNGGCSVRQSAQAYADLKKAFYGTDQPVSTPDKRVVVIIEDPKH